jgi:hypothetical protein
MPKALAKVGDQVGDAWAFAIAKAPPSPPI